METDEIAVSVKKSNPGIVQTHPIKTNAPETATTKLTVTIAVRIRRGILVKTTVSIRFATTAIGQVKTVQSTKKTSQVPISGLIT